MLKKFRKWLSSLMEIHYKKTEDILESSCCSDIPSALRNLPH